MREIPIQPLEVRSLAPVIGAGRAGEVATTLQVAREALGGRTVWNVNSTATGGGVAEMLVRLLGYTSGAGIRSPWIVVEGDDPFFRVTKRLHHLLHGMPGDGGPLGRAEQRCYERVLAAEAETFCALLRRDDVVVLNDPQTLALAGPARQVGAVVVWRNHIGADRDNEHSERGWAFLRPYLDFVDVCIFSRLAYAPGWLDAPVVVIPPTIDPLSEKNRALDDRSIGSILDVCGFEPMGTGTLAAEPAVSRRARIERDGPPPARGAAMVVQVSRWDPLKDPVGVMEAFSRLDLSRHDCHLALVGPDSEGVADDPEAQAVLERCIRRWRDLPDRSRCRIHLVSLPVADVDENALMVNAIQRRATIIVQKSLAEGFGLTVTEAMWKQKPVVASAVGGIQDQIVHGEHGWLLQDPRDPDELAGALDRLLRDHARAATMAANARERVRERFLDDRQLCDWAELFTRLGSRQAA